MLACGGGHPSPPIPPFAAAQRSLRGQTGRGCRSHLARIRWQQDRSGARTGTWDRIKDQPAPQPPRGRPARAPGRRCPAGGPGSLGAPKGSDRWQPFPLPVPPPRPRFSQNLPRKPPREASSLASPNLRPHNFCFLVSTILTCVCSCSLST